MEKTLKLESEVNISVILNYIKKNHVAQKVNFDVNKHLKTTASTRKRTALISTAGSSVCLQSWRQVPIDNVGIGNFIL